MKGIIILQTVLWSFFVVFVLSMPSKVIIMAQFMFLGINTGCSLGIGDRRIRCLLHRILRQNFACFLTELRPSHNKPPVTFQYSPVSPIFNETPVNMFWAFLRAHFNAFLMAWNQMSLGQAQSIFMLGNINSIVLLLPKQRLFCLLKIFR